MANNSLVNFRANRQFQSLLEVLTESFPDNVLLQDKLGDLITKKSSYIKKLQQMWTDRDTPDFDEQDIREMNLKLRGSRLGN